MSNLYKNSVKYNIGDIVYITPWRLRHEVPDGFWVKVADPPVPGSPEFVVKVLDRTTEPYILVSTSWLVS